MKSKKIFIITLFFGILFGLGDSQSQTSSEKIDETIDLLKNRDINVRKKAVKDLGELGNNKAITSLINTYKDEKQDIREEVTAALCSIGKPAVSQLLVALDDDSDVVKEEAAKALSCMGVTAVDLLISEMRNTFSILHDKVKEILVKIGTPAVEPVINTLKTSEDSEVKIKMVEILGNIADTRAVDPLLGFINYQDDMFLRCAVVIALGNIKDARAVDPLIEALKVEEGGVRVAILESLAKIKDKRAIPPIVELLKKDKSVQNEIIKCLSELMDSSEFESFMLANKDELGEEPEK